MSGSKPYYGPVEALTMEEAAARCDLGLIAFGKRLRDGEIPKPFRIGDLERWAPAALEDFRWSAKRGCSLYVIGTDGSDFVKIGIAQSVSDRMKALQTGCPFDLVPLVTMPGSLYLERRFHRALRKYHVRGEWFRVGPWFDEVTAWGHAPDRDTVWAWLKARSA